MVARCEPSRGALDSALTQVDGISVSVARQEPNYRVAGVTACDQNPCDTVHVLANGTVVPCEVQDKRSMGNLSETTERSVAGIPEATRTFSGPRVNPSSSSMRGRASTRSV
jgi:hypothetical protein